jgi:hypothetical protein
MEGRPPIWKVASNKLNKQLRTSDKGCSSSLGLERGAKSSPQTWTDILVQRKWDMLFGTWNVSSLYRAGLLL